MGANCSPLLTLLVLHDFESSATVKLSCQWESLLVRCFVFRQRIIDYLITINNLMFDQPRNLCAGALAEGNFSGGWEGCLFKPNV